MNRMMPGPAIEVCRGDTIVADIENSLMGDSTSIHWHGLHQRGSKWKHTIAIIKLIIITDRRIDFRPTLRWCSASNSMSYSATHDLSVHCESG